MGVRIGLVVVDAATDEKLRHRRGLTGAEVRAAVEWPAVPVRAAWNDVPEHGRRLIVYAEWGAKVLKVVLMPLDEVDGTWLLKTAVVSSER